MAIDDGRVVSNLIVQALKKEPLTIYGNGSQTRSFCYVDDLVDAITAATEVAPFSTPINIGNYQEFTILQLANAIIELVGHDLPIQELPLPEDDPKVRRPDLSIANQILGWNPKVPLQDGLVKTVGYFKNHLEQQLG
jgi:UDP-glucuronate decarboxylase